MNIKIISGFVFVLLITSLIFFQNKSSEQIDVKNTPLISKSASSTSTTSPNLKYDEENLKPVLVASEWVWVKTELGTRPVTDPKLVIEPNIKGDFIMTFSDDGSVSIKTDCNNMGGRYKFLDNKITFDSIISTMMFCEGSKEHEFSKMLQPEKIYHLSFSDGNTRMFLTSDQTMYFERK